MCASLDVGLSDEDEGLASPDRGAAGTPSVCADSPQTIIASPLPPERVAGAAVAAVAVAAGEAATTSEGLVSGTGGAVRGRFQRRDRDGLRKSRGSISGGFLFHVAGASEEEQNSPAGADELAAADLPWGSSATSPGASPPVA